MKTIISAMVATVMAGTALTAFAQPGDHPWYVGVNANYADALSAPNNTADTKASVDEYAINAHLGYLFAVMPNFSVGPQLGYTTYGQFTVSGKNGASGKAKYTTSAFNLSAVGQYDINRLFYIQGRAGVSNLYLNGSGGVKSSTGKDHKTKNDNFWEPRVGLSFGYNIGQSFAVDLNYDHLFGDSFRSKLENLDNQKSQAYNTFGVGVTYRF